jgi:hypothetical protein
LNSKLIFQVAVLITNNTVSPPPRDRKLIGGCSGATPTCSTALNPILNSKLIFQVAVLVTNNTVSPPTREREPIGGCSGATPT